MKKVIKVDNESDGFTRVTINVPEFHNFGQRMGELELKHTEANLADWGKGDDDPELDADITTMNKQMGEMMEGLMGLMMEKTRKQMPPEEAEAMQKSMKSAIDSFKESMDEAEDDDSDSGPPVIDKESYKYDLQTLEVSLSEEMKWNEAIEKMVDQFLANWPKIRPAVLQRTLELYKEYYPEVRSYLKGPEYDGILPEPSSPEAVADIFRITTIYPHENGAIGLSGPCTWDEEHAYGVLIQDGKVVEVGGADVAF